MPTENANYEGFTFRGPEANQVLLAPIFVGQNILTENFQVLRNVKTERTMHHLSAPSKILQTNSGCGWNASGTMTLEPRTIQVGRVKVNVEQCNDEFFDTALEELLGNELDIDRLSATQLGRQLLDSMTTTLQSAIQQDTYLQAFLAGYDNEGGLSTPAWYTRLGKAGILQKIETAIAAGEPIVQVDNGGSDYSGSAMTDTLAIGLLRGMYEGQSKELRGVPDSRKRFDVTQDIYDKYQEYLEDLGTEEAHRITVNGMPRLSYRGIPIFGHQHLQEELVSTFSLTSPHRAILTVDRNLAVATDITSAANRYVVWYEEKDEKWYFKAKFKLGFDFVHPEFVVYAK